MKAFIPFDVCRLRDFVEDSLDIYRVGLHANPVRKHDLECEALALYSAILYFLPAAIIV